MHAYTFDGHGLKCPGCRRPIDDPSAEEFCCGLYICQSCRERFVISWSGHYVRDPFTLKQLAIGRVLRRQSRPLYRVLRDIGIAKHSSLIAVLGGALLLGLTFVAVGGLISGANWDRGVSESRQDPAVLDRAPSPSSLY